MENRRKYKRVKVKDGSFATQSNIGEIIDISINGLAFRYVDRGGGGGGIVDSPGSGILFGSAELFLDNLPYKVISDHVIGRGASVMRRCGVQFEKLTPEQLAQIEYYIMINIEISKGGKYSA